MYPQRPLDAFASLWRNRRLAFQLARRDVVGRYRGSYLGLLWSFFNPLLMLAAYTLVFGVVFKARWATGVSDSKIEFAIILFVGLLVYGIFSECVNRAPGLVLGRANFVKRVVFPLEILPWVGLLSSPFHAVVNLLVLFTAMIFVFSGIAATAPLFLLVLLPLVLFTLGFSWALAGIGVYVRDVAQTVGVVTAALMFVSPIFYPAAALPEQFRWLFTLNPMAFIIEQARDVLIWGKLPDFQQLGILTLVGAVIAWLGFVVFQRMRVGFADVL
ncbi:MAG: ABC transporter permease [Casimicrobiaceae bacterium]